MEDEPRIEASEPTSGGDPDLATLVGLEAELADLDADLAQVDRSDHSEAAPRDVDGGEAADA